MLRVIQTYFNVVADVLFAISFALLLLGYRTVLPLPIGFYPLQCFNSGIEVMLSLTAIPSHLSNA